MNGIFCIRPMHFKLNRAIIKKILLCLLTFFSYFIGIAFFIHSQTLFLEKIGLEKLPFVLAAGGVLMIIYSLISSLIGSRFSAPLRFAFFAMLISVFYLFIYFLPQNEFLQVTLFFLTSNFLFDFLDISIINVSSSLISPLESKTVLPFVNCFSSLGVIVGCYFALQIQGYNERVGIGLLPAMALLIVVFLALLIVNIYKKDLAPAPTQFQKSNDVKQVKEAFQFVFHQSRLFKTLALVFFLFIAIRVSVSFKLKTSMGLNFTGNELTDMFAKIYMVESALTFFIDLFLTKRLLFRFGVMRLMLAYPVIMLCFLGVAIASGLQPLFVIIFALSCSVPLYSAVSVASLQVFSIAPKEKTQQVYFLIMGLLSSLTRLAITLSLFVYSVNIDFERTLNTGLIAFFIILLFVAVLRLKGDYQIELKKALFKEDVYLKHQAIELLAEKTQRNQGEIQLRRLLNLKGTDEETKFKTMNSLGIIGNYQTVNDFIKVLKGGNPREMFAALQAISAIIRSRREFDHYPITKHLLFKTYREIFISNVPHYIKLEIISALKYFNLEEVIDFLEKNLQSDDSQVKINVIETLDSFNDRAIIQYLEPFLNSPNVRVLASTVAALWKFPDMRIYLVPKLVMIISEKTAEAEESSLFLIGSIKAFWEKKFVRRLCKSENPHIRRSAYVTMINLGEKKYLDDLLEELVVLARKTAENEKISKPDKLEVEFILSQYRKFSHESKDLFIAKIQQVPAKDVHAVYECFFHSRYMFIQELDDLTY